MKLRRVRLQRFRGIKDMTIDLGDTTVLIGENNCGKTAVLDAIRICMKHVRGNGGFAFSAHDLHLENAAADPVAADPLQVTLTFREDKEGEWSNADVRALKGFVVDHEDRYQVTLHVQAQYDATVRDYVQSTKFLDAAGNELSTTSSMVSKIQSRVSYYYLAALRDAGAHFGAKGEFWRPFLKAGNLPEEKKQEIEGLLSDLNDNIVASHESFKVAIDHLKGIQDVLPLGDGDVVSIEAVPARASDILSRARVGLGGKTGARIPVSRHGEGTQSLAVLMLFRAFIEAWPQHNPFVALEEPEAHLHPSAIRALWSTVEKLSGQKLVTTHSGDLLSEIPVEELRRLHRGPNGIECRRLQATTLSATQKRKFDFHVRHSRGELLFARCWLLVEGETEQVLIPEIARAMGKSFAQSGVRCVPYRQADIELFLKVANDFGIAWCVMPDDDAQGKKDLVKVRANLAGQVEAEVLFVPPQADMEQVLCAAGFGAVYEKRTSAQKLQNHPITAQKGTPDYWSQLLCCMEKGYKTAAPHEIIEAIGKGAEVPSFLKTVVSGAIALAEKH